MADVARREEFKLTSALVTHHHADHSQGAQELRQRFPDVHIYGADSERIDGLTDVVVDGQVINFNRIEVHCIATPGHTTSHVCYYVVDKQTDQKALFTGDTIFLAGCGKFFECPATVMYDTIYNKLFPKVPDVTVSPRVSALTPL